MEMSFLPCPHKDESVGRFKPAHTDKGPEDNDELLVRTV